MNPTKMTTIGMVPSIEIMEKAVEDLQEAYKLNSLIQTFLTSIGKTQLDGFTRLNNFSIIKEQQGKREQCQLHSTYKMRPYNGISGMRRRSLTCNGRNLHKPCVSILGLLTMKILTKLQPNCNKLELCMNTKHSLNNQQQGYKIDLNARWWGVALEDIRRKFVWKSNFSCQPLFFMPLVWLMCRKTSYNNFDDHLFTQDLHYHQQPSLPFTNSFKQGCIIAGFQTKNPKQSPIQKTFLDRDASTEG